MLNSIGERPVWNEKQAARLVGAKVLIGITRSSADDSDQEQMFGIVTSANPLDGFEVRLEGSRKGETYWLPPDLRNFSPAQPGDYRVRSTGEVVTNPDYLSTWVLEPAAR
jgi:hypothetical protein